MDYQTYYYNSKPVYYIEVDPSIYDLQLVSKPVGGSRLTIQQFMDNTPGAVAAINGQLFSGSSYVGGCKDSQGNIRGYFNGYYPSLVYNNNTLQEEWIYSNSDIPVCDFAMNSAYYCFLRNGMEVTDYAADSPDSAYYYYSSHLRSMIGIRDGNIILAVTTNGFTAHEQAEAMIGIGCSLAFNLDGGGSTSLRVGTTRRGSDENRAVMNSIVVTRKELNNIYLKAHNSSFRIRSNVISGTTLTVVYPPERAAIRAFRNGIESDGYQWAKTEKDSYTGYSQLDTSNDYLIETDDSFEAVLYLKAETCSFRIRAREVDGETYDIVYTGDRARILQFGNGFKSDGYQWVKVQRGNTIGWSQLDLQAYAIVQE